MLSFTQSPPPFLSDDQDYLHFFWKDLYYYYQFDITILLLFFFSFLFSFRFTELRFQNCQYFHEWRKLSVWSLLSYYQYFPLSHWTFVLSELILQPVAFLKLSGFANLWKYGFSRQNAIFFPLLAIPVFAFLLLRALRLVWY